VTIQAGTTTGRSSKSYVQSRDRCYKRSLEHRFLGTRDLENNVGDGRAAQTSERLSAPRPHQNHHASQRFCNKHIERTKKGFFLGPLGAIRIVLTGARVVPSTSLATITTFALVALISARSLLTLLPITTNPKLLESS
jgi:hypothetical protein